MLNVCGVYLNTHPQIAQSSVAFSLTTQIYTHAWGITGGVVSGVFLIVAAFGLLRKKIWALYLILSAGVLNLVWILNDLSRSIFFKYPFNPILLIAAFLSLVYILPSVRYLFNSTAHTGWTEIDTGPQFFLVAKIISFLSGTALLGLGFVFTFSGYSYGEFSLVLFFVLLSIVLGIISQVGIFTYKKWAMQLSGILAFFSFIPLVLYGSSPYLDLGALFLVLYSGYLWRNKNKFA